MYYVGLLTAIRSSFHSQNGIAMNDMLNVFPYHSVLSYWREKNGRYWAKYKL